MSNAALKMPPGAPQRFSTAKAVKYKAASKNKRVIALLLDGIILTVAMQVLTVATKPLVAMGGGFLFLPAAINFLPMIYMVMFSISMGASPGKQFLGLKIVHKDGRSQVSGMQFFIRESIGRMVAVLPLCLGYVWISFNKEHKGWHDMISKTWVVEEN